MIFDKQGNTTVITQETVSLVTFVKRLADGYAKYKKDNIILNLFSLKDLKTSDMLEFLDFSNAHRANKRSLVIVARSISVDEVPDEIAVVPTLQEAHDIIEMEEIERDLEI